MPKTKRRARQRRAVALLHRALRRPPDGLPVLGDASLDHLRLGLPRTGVSTTHLEDAMLALEVVEQTRVPLSIRRALFGAAMRSASSASDDFFRRRAGLILTLGRDANLLPQTQMLPWW